VKSANVACGFHASDPTVMVDTVKLCQLNGVSIGAHPGFADLEGFGRRVINLTIKELEANIAYQIGAGIGSTKHKGDFSLTAFWQHAEQYSLDPNLVDSDLFDSRVNLEGAVFQFGYALSDAVTANLTYAHAWQIDHNLGTGGVGDLGLNPVDNYNLFQADLSVKF